LVTEKKTLFDISGEKGRQVPLAHTCGRLCLVYSQQQIKLYIHRPLEFVPLPQKTNIVDIKHNKYA